MKRILLVHCGDQSMELLRECLENESFEVNELRFGQDVLDTCSSAHPDVLVLDAAADIWEAVDVCVKLRSHSHLGRTPVLMIGDALSETERILALELGANDYVMRPFSPREVVARVKVQLRYTCTSPAVLRAGSLELNRLRYEVSLQGRNILLTPNEFRILEALMTRAGAVLSDRQLVEYCWGTDTAVNEGTIKVYIVRLRRKLGDDAAQPRIIRSVRGFGYAVEPVTAG